MKTNLKRRHSSHHQHLCRRQHQSPVEQQQLIVHYYTRNSLLLTVLTWHAMETQEGWQINLLIVATRRHPHMKSLCMTFRCKGMIIYFASFYDYCLSQLRNNYFTRCAKPKYLYRPYTQDG